MAEKLKNTAQGGQDQFGTHSEFEKEVRKGGGVPQLLIKELEGSFDSLDNASTMEKETDLVKSYATLTTSNATLTATIVGLQKQLGTIGRSKKNPNPYPH